MKTKIIIHGFGTPMSAFSEAKRNADRNAEIVKLTGELHASVPKGKTPKVIKATQAELDEINASIN